MAGAGVVQIEKLQASIEGDMSSRANTTATGGRASTGMVFNSSSAGGTFGLVKMLTLAGIALIAFRLWRKK